MHQWRQSSLKVSVLTGIGLFLVYGEFGGGGYHFTIGDKKITYLIFIPDELF